MFAEFIEYVAAAKEAVIDFNYVIHEDNSRTLVLAVKEEAIASLCEDHHPEIDSLYLKKAVDSINSHLTDVRSGTDLQVIRKAYEWLFKVYAEFCYMLSYVTEDSDQHNCVDQWTEHACKIIPAELSK